MNVFLRGRGRLGGHEAVGDDAAYQIDHEVGEQAMLEDCLIEAAMSTGGINSFAYWRYAT
jgi:hypothetical protein